VRVSQSVVVAATVVDTGELAARPARVFAGYQTIIDPAHHDELKRLRQRRREPPQVAWFSTGETGLLFDRP
jgi:hypothetical protein